MYFIHDGIGVDQVFDDFVEHNYIKSATGKWQLMTFCTGDER